MAQHASKVSQPTNAGDKAIQTLSCVMHMPESIREVAGNSQARRNLNTVGILNRINRKLPPPELRRE